MFKLANTEMACISHFTALVSLYDVGLSLIQFVITLTNHRYNPHLSSNYYLFIYLFNIDCNHNRAYI